MALAPDPFDDDVERLLADPKFVAELEARRARAERGETVTVDDPVVRERLRELGVPLIDPSSPE